MTKRPNILFILSDQHSPHYCGWMDGAGLAQTPNLDRLASQGAVLENAYCQNPLCVPSRSSLLTGRYSRNLGIYNNRQILPANSPTLPRSLAAAGYRTCLIGKAHFNGEQWHGYQQRPYGDLHGQGHQPDPRRTPEKGSAGLGDNILTQAGPSGIPEDLTQTEICVAETVKWLQTHVALQADQPFFLSLNFDKPHFPINPPARFMEQYEGKVRLPETFTETPEEEDRTSFFHGTLKQMAAKGSPEEHRHTLQAYLGCVSWVDEAVGRVLDVLDYLGLAENTIVVYSSDHGEMGSEFGAWNKTLFYEASSRVPMIVRWPGRIAPETRRRELVGLVDLFPTLCDAAGAECPESLDGISLVELLTAVQSRETVLYGYFEAKCKAMRSHGSSAFWFYNSQPDWWTEIDVFEIAAGAPEEKGIVHMNLHLFREPGDAEMKHRNMHSKKHAISFDPAEDYHVYGVEWDPKIIRYYIDGRLIVEVTNTHWHQPLTLNFDSETMPDWFGLPNEEDLPSTFSTEYIRAWKRKEA